MGIEQGLRHRLALGDPGRNGMGREVAFPPTWSLTHQVRGAAVLCPEPPSSPPQAGTEPGQVGGAWRRPPQKHPTSLPACLDTGCPQTSLCALGCSCCCMLFSCSAVSNSLRSHGLQHARLPSPSQSPGLCSNSCLLSQ